MKNLVEIKNDCYFIDRRLKEIDKSYQIFFNLARGTYEVHSSEQEKNSYCFTIPFDTLDERTIFYARKTRSENRDKIIKEIEENNLKIEKNNEKMQINALKELICL